MDTQKIQRLIGKMIYPGVTVNSLTMFANKLDASYGQEALCEFFAALCRQDICKAVKVTRRLFHARRSAAESVVSQILAERCKSADGFSHLELLAVAVCKDAQLLQTAIPYLSRETVKKAMKSADGLDACDLLQLSLTVLPPEPCAWVREEFCKLLSAEYDERMEKALPELLPSLLKQGVTDVLTVLVEIVGAERVFRFYGEGLPEELDRLIYSGEDSVGVWELYFHHFFQQEYTQEQLLADGLWHVQLHAGEDIYDQVCASFFLHAATRYGVELPIFDYMEDFSSPQSGTRHYILRYKDAIRPLWENPPALSRFLEKTAPCNPFREQRVQAKRYQILRTAQDRTGYDRLRSLFEARLPVNAILNVFFSTDLKRRLPLEDVFYLARCYEVLPDLLTTLQDYPFTGMVASQDPRRLYVSPYSYFSTILHTVPVTYRILEELGNGEQLKGTEVQYTITAFVGGHIQVNLCGAGQLLEGKNEDVVTWEMAIEELRREKDLQKLTEKQLQQFAITEFALDDVMGENHINLFTGLLMERADCLEAFLKLLSLCKWNAAFLKPELQLPRELFNMRDQYQQDAEELFRYLLVTLEDMALVLQLYFTSIYRAIVPLSQLLLLAPRDLLLEHLPNFQVCCRLLEEGSSLCRPSNINCAPVCVMESMEGISHTEVFVAVITDFVVVDNYVFRIFLQPYQMGAADIEERGALFGNLASNMHINQRRAQRLATLPSAADCGIRELKFNIRCMEDAVMLRRSNAAELKYMIQVLGDANPFAFGVSFTAERIYLNKQKRKKIQDSVVSMVLNAKNMEDIRDFYLHTHIKFHLPLPQLAELIRERRSDLEDDIPGMFEGVTFSAIADSWGKVWMPWVEQNTLQVSGEYAGKVLSCEIRMEKDGSVHVNVKEANQSEAFFEILENCLLSGYRIDQDMNALVESLQMTMPTDTIQPEETDLPEEGTLSFNHYFIRLKKKLYDEQFSHEAFSQAIQKMIVSYDQQSAAGMEQAVITMTRKWLHLYPDREKIPLLLQEICCCFGQKYHNGHLCKSLTQLLYEYFGLELAQTFDAQMQVYISPLEEQDEKSRNKLSFEETCQKMQLQLSNNFYLSSKVLQLIGLYRNLISQEEMEAGISELTAQWMQMYTIDAPMINEFLKLHKGFIDSYQSGSLGLILCRQADQYLSEINSDRMERGICKITYQRLGNHPELEQMLPPFAQRVARMHSRIEDPQFPNNDAAKRISRLIQYYGSFISAAQMEQTVLELTEKLLKDREGYRSMRQLIINLHATFENSYGVSSFGRTLWLQARQYLQSEIAESLLSPQPMSMSAVANRIRILLQSNEAIVTPEELAQTITELTAQWIPHYAGDPQLSFYLCNIHEGYMKNSSQDHLAGPLCQLVGEYLGEDAAKTLAEQLENPSPIVQEENASE